MAYRRILSFSLNAVVCHSLSHYSFTTIQVQCVCLIYSIQDIWRLAAHYLPLPNPPDGSSHITQNMPPIPWWEALSCHHVCFQFKGMLTNEANHLQLQQLPLTWCLFVTLFATSVNIDLYALCCAICNKALILLDILTRFISVTTRLQINCPDISL